MFILISLSNVVLLFALCNAWLEVLKFITQKLIFDQLSVA